MRNESWVISDGELEFLNEIKVVTTEGGMILSPGWFLVVGYGAHEGTLFHEFEMMLLLNTSPVMNDTFSPPALEDPIIHHSNNPDNQIEGSESVACNLTPGTTTSQSSKEGALPHVGHTHKTNISQDLEFQRQSDKLTFMAPCSELWWTTACVEEVGIVQVVSTPEAIR